MIFFIFILIGIIVKAKADPTSQLPDPPCTYIELD